MIVNMGTKTYEMSHKQAKAILGTAKKLADCNIYGIEKGILCGNLITQNSAFNTVYDLCPKCMEDFERFKRNDR